MEQMGNLTVENNDYNDNVAHPNDYVYHHEDYYNDENPDLDEYDDSDDPDDEDDERDVTIYRGEVEQCFTLISQRAQSAVFYWMLISREHLMQSLHLPQSVLQRDIALKIGKLVWDSHNSLSVWLPELTCEIFTVILYEGVTLQTALREEESDEESDEESECKKIKYE
jgi:hypothetical protein